MTQQLNGQVMVITGATSGIGLAAATALAGAGAWVIGVGRSAEKCTSAQDEICRACPDARVNYLLADLSAQRQVRALAVQIGDLLAENGAGKLDVLVNNAGAVASWYTATEDGYELQFALNHLAPYLLTHDLLPLLQKAPAARVLTVSSRSHRNMWINWRDVMFRRGYNPLLAYKQSKLANVLFTAGLNQRMAGASLRAFAIDPGLVNTEIGLKGTMGIASWVWNLRKRGGQTPAQGASTLVYVASQVDLPAGYYWKDCQPVDPSRYARRVDVIDRLWSLSAQLCGISPDWQAVHFH